MWQGMFLQHIPVEASLRSLKGCGSVMRGIFKTTIKVRANFSQKLTGCGRVLQGMGMEFKGCGGVLQGILRPIIRAVAIF